MSWSRFVLGVVMAASCGLVGCVLQGDRHEDRLRNEMCAAAEEAAKSCGDLVFYDPPVSEEGKAVEPPPTVVKSPEQVGFDCASSQIRLQNLCGPEIDELNACVLDHLDTSVVGKRGLDQDEIPTDALHFACFEQKADFDDPGHVDKDGKKGAYTIIRYTETGDVMVLGYSQYGICVEELAAVTDCAGGR